MTRTARDRRWRRVAEIVYFLLWVAALLAVLWHIERAPRTPADKARRYCAAWGPVRIVPVTTGQHAPWDYSRARICQKYTEAPDSGAIFQGY